MPLDPDIVSMLRQTIYVAPFLGTESANDGGSEGNSIFDTPQPWAARVEPTTDNDDQMASGEDIKSAYRIITPAPVGQKDHVWLPGDDATDDAAGRFPNRVAVRYDENGAYLYTTVLV